MGTTIPEREIIRPPGFFALYASSLRRALTRSQGRLAHGDVAGFPRLAASRRAVRADPALLRAYAAVCGFDERSETLPLAFPETLCLPLMAAIATAAEFPLSPFGLIHVGQRLAQSRAIGRDEPLDLRCEVGSAESGPMGITVHIEMTGHASGEPVWTGEAALLSRGERSRSRGRLRKRSVESIRIADPANAAQIEIDAPEDTGRRFARVSGDWNPHHLHWTVARLLGYPRPIAHGMWTLSRALAELERAGTGTLSRVDVRFRRPLYLPGRAQLRFEEADGAIELEVRQADGAAVHLTGRAQR